MEDIRIKGLLRPITTYQGMDLPEPTKGDASDAAAKTVGVSGRMVYEA